MQVIDRRITIQLTGLQFPCSLTDYWLSRCLLFIYYLCICVGFLLGLQFFPQSKNRIWLRVTSKLIQAVEVDVNVFLWHMVVSACEAVIDWGKVRVVPHPRLQLPLGWEKDQSVEDKLFNMWHISGQFAKQPIL